MMIGEYPYGAGCFDIDKVVTGVLTKFPNFGSYKKESFFGPFMALNGTKSFTRIS